jgi:anti-sigma B factor antagonist
MSVLTTAQPNESTTVITFAEQVLGGPEAVDLSSKLRDYIAQGRSTIVFDLGNVRIMNSSGLGMLVSSLTSLRKANVALVLASVPEKVMSLLDMTHLRTVFTICPSVDDALQTAQ